MAIEIQVYTPAQMDQLTQFKRTEKWVRFLRPHWRALEMGLKVNLSDSQGAIETDIVGARAMVGALRGMFDEILDAGLLEAIK